METGANERDYAMITERLARIEQLQLSQGEQLDRVLRLLDRMVRVEERQEAFMEDNRILTDRLNKREVIVNHRFEGIEKELGSWRTTKTVMNWMAGILASIIVGIVLIIVAGTVNEGEKHAQIFKEFSDPFEHVSHQIAEALQHDH